MPDTAGSADYRNARSVTEGPPPPWGDHVFTADEGWCDYHHEIETGLTTCYRSCFECGHIWSREALEANYREMFGHHKPAEELFACGACAHDF